MPYPIFSKQWIEHSCGYKSGNSVVDYHDKHDSEGEPYIDRYICTACRGVVTEQFWIKKHFSCRDCYEKFLEEQKNKKEK